MNAKGHIGSDRSAWARDVEPAAVWQEFAALTAIPRRSKHEEAVRRHVVDRLAGLGLVPRVDATGNVAADLPASPGAETAPTAILQVHLDMVCEADADAGTDPATDGVFPVLADGWVQAPGTTLGADDGIGVATALAIAVEATGRPRRTGQLRHPPLQLLFTVDEEEDFSGAAGVHPPFVGGRVLLNLDAEDEREVIIGSAGGARVFVRVPAEWEAAPSAGAVVQLRVGGLQGGHSGQQIHENLGNALRGLGQTLALAADLLGDGAAGQLRIARLEGGRADNAIPREATAALVVDAAGLDALERAAATVEGRLRSWRAGADDGARVEVVRGDGPRPERVLSVAAARRVVDLLVTLPSGVIAMDEALPGVVRTSANLGVAFAEGDQIVLVSAPRSSRPGDLDELFARYVSYARLAGGRAEVASRYPAWQPDFHSVLLETVRAAYAEVHGRQPTVTAVHAGLEAGEIASHLPGLLAVSIGPTVRGAHGPGERLEVSSVGRFHAFVLAILDRLAAAGPGA